MPDIDIHHRHAMSKDEARSAAERVVRDLKQELDFEHYWEGDVLRFRRSGAKGHIAVEEQAVRVAVELGWLFKAMRAPIRREAERLLEEHLGRAE